MDGPFGTVLQNWSRENFVCREAYDVGVLVAHCREAHLSIRRESGVAL